jgi:HEPN domain-containing protein
MTNWTLWQDYFHRAKIRRQILSVLMTHQAYADVVRESQELVELLLKGLLRRASIDPPKWHDVGKILEEQRLKLPHEVVLHLPRIMTLSSRLRKEREMSFYGDDDFIPSEQYQEADATWCVNEVDWLLNLLQALTGEG